MSTPNELEEATLALPDLALGILPAVEAERLMAIVRLNPRLQAELASLRGATSALALTAPPAPMPADRQQALRDRLLARIADGSTGAPIDASAPEVVPALRHEPYEARPAPVIREVQVPARLSMVQRAAPLLAIATLVLFVVSVFRLRDTLQERNDARVALRNSSAAATVLSARLAQSDSLVAAMSDPDVRVVELGSTQSMSPGARMFWDRATHRWTLVTHDLAPVPAGRTYQLWLVTVNAEQVSAGTFDTDAKGRAVVQATYALAEADLSAIAITEEPAGGSSQPTGSILVSGTAAR